MRIALFAVALSGLAEASTDYEVGPRVVDSLGALNDGLGYGVAACSIPTGGALAAAGSLGTYVAIARLPVGANSSLIEQRLQSGLVDDGYGLSVALGGSDCEFLAVGAPADDSLGFNAGRVYVYRRPGVGMPFALLSTLNPPAPSTTGNFGVSVALATDGTRLLVGEPKAQLMGFELGAVHLYSLSAPGVGPAQSVYGDLGTGSRFGQSIAISGSRVAIGAPLADDASMLADTGALRVLSLAGTTFSFDGAALYANDRAAGDRLGLAVSIESDLLISGAGNDDKPVGPEAGSAYVFRRDGGWQQEAKLRSTSSQAQERFGQSVALRGNEALVGAYCLNPGGCVGTGAVYVFGYDGSNWLSKQRLTAIDASNFGHSVAYADQDRMVIGAFGSDANFVDQGAIFTAFPADRLLVDGFED